MYLTNSTNLQANLVSGGLKQGEKGAVLVARATFRFDGRQLAPSEQAWPVFIAPTETAVGKFPTDFHLLRSGCDLVVVGNAEVPRPVTSLVAMVRVGQFSRSMVVSGHRVWRAAGNGNLVAGPPEPFTAMPLDWSRAFGGTATLMGQPTPYPLNPKGIGYYGSAEEAEGRPLPNLEDPAHRIQRWDERPLPLSWWPVDDSVTWQLATWVLDRASSGEDPSDPTALAERCVDCFPTPSIPSMVMPSLRGGEQVSISLGTVRLDFAVPELRYVVRASVGVRRMERRLALTGLWVIIPQRLVVITMQARFRYRFRPHEKRIAVLEACS